VIPGKFRLPRDFFWNLEPETFGEIKLKSKNRENGRFGRLGAVDVKRKKEEKR
jgi:hypothetical protein